MLRGLLVVDVFFLANMFSDAVEEGLGVFVSGAGLLEVSERDSVQKLSYYCT